jgi:DNA-binding Lrp family transcriptional regulator
MEGPTLRLLNEFQHRFPLSHAPFAEIAERLGQSERWVLQALSAAQNECVISRIGAVFAPRVIGASVLAALRVPEAELDRVAELVSKRTEVNHNYEREHDYNLWFVAAAADGVRLDAALREIEAEVACGPLLSLPLLDEYRIDLGFDLAADFPGAARGVRVRSIQRPRPLSEPEKRLVAALQPGLDLVPHPYTALAERARMGEAECLEWIRRWIHEGTVRRFGIIVRHRELGYRANAMVVWDVPDALATALGLRLAEQPGVTLAYRRRRSLPDWPYNLYCMVHGRDREAVLDHIDRLRRASGLSSFRSHILFSRRCFKQRGAQYFHAKEAAHA